MHFPSRLQLRQKFLLILALPLLTVLGFAAYVVKERVAEVQLSERVQQLAKVTQLLNTVHLLQFERSLARIYVVGRAPEDEAAWESASYQTDESVAAMQALAQSLGKEGADALMLQGMQNVLQGLRGLAPLRARIKSADSNYDTVDAYTGLVSQIHSNLARMRGAAPGSGIRELQGALRQITFMKDFIGLHRGLGLTAIRAGGANDEQRRTLLQLQAKLDLVQEQVNDLESEAYRHRIQQIVTGAAGRRLAEMRSVLLSPNASASNLPNADLWLQTVTQLLDELHDLEIAVMGDLKEYADETGANAISALVATAIIALASTLLTAGIVNGALNKLIDAFYQLRDGAVAFGNSGELKPVAVQSHDEFGEVALAYNSLMATLQTTSEVVEAVASGDFSHQLETKGGRDRLSNSLNHMINKLRESMAEIRRENWLKTGQSELASHLNSDVPVQELAQRALNFLARYLEAPVGALYIVDDEGTARLCASFAFTFRKENANVFARGESLVGQAVLERQAIVLRETPPEYVRVSSGLGVSAPRDVVVLPLIYTERVLAVLELGSLQPLTEAQMQMLTAVSENLAIALHAALSRERLAELLEETQAQAEELQSQQAELEAANSELEEQATQLEESQSELRAQQQQLQLANEELLHQTTELESRNQQIELRSHELESARHTLELKAEELTLASKYKSEFLANMSHELRTPLNSLLLLAQTLKSNPDNNLSAEQIEALTIIHSSGRDLLNLINDILDLSKVEAGKLRIEHAPVSLSQIVTTLRQQFQPLAESKRLSFAIVLDSTLPADIHTDEQRLLQILRNLIGNAIKFTDSGTVDVRVAPSIGGYIDFAVHDTGIGIPKKLQQAIFEAFQQGDGATNRKYSGTGLGLTISRELARLLGGTIELQSEEQKGSLFVLRFPHEALDAESGVAQTQTPPVPYARPAPVLPTAPAETTVDELPMFLPDDRNELDPRHETLLIIEDDVVFARCLMELARNRGFRCLMAGDAGAGIALARHYRPQAIILDMVLPDGSGNQVMAQLQGDAQTASIPVHIVSSLDREDVDAPSAIGVLMKPISKESIDNAFNNILRHMHPSRHRCVLVIEDDDSTRLAVKKLLDGHDVEVMQAATGAEARRLLAQHVVDCVILDLNLPDLDATTILDQIAGENVAEPLPVVIYTGKDLDHDEYKRLRQYTNHIIIKGSLAQERLLNDVTLFLHSLQPEPRKLPAAPAVDGDALAGKKVLIVDDDMRNTFALATLLRRHGVKVLMADNGQLALERLAEHADIDMTIMDIMMPVMDGFETIKHIRAKNDYRNLPIIALTAKAMPEDRDKCLSVGANDYLAKPVDADRLLATLKLWATA